MLLGPGEDSLAKSIAAYSGIADINLLQVCIGNLLCRLFNMAYLLNTGKNEPAVQVAGDLKKTVNLRIILN